MENSGEEIPLLHLLPMLQRIISLTDSHKKFGLTKSQMIILIILHYKANMMMGEIAQYISSSKEQATRAVAGLCDNGLVERYELPSNRTRVYIRFTEKGREYRQVICQQLRAELYAKLKTSLSEEDLQKLKQSVQTTVEVLSKVQ